MPRAAIAQPAKTPRPAGCRLRLFRRFKRNEAGATAVEFGFVGLPFLALLFAIMETALTFWNTQVLETAVSNASRQVYTGEFQQSSTNSTATATQLAERFKTAVCTEVRGMFDCTNMLKVDVRTYSSFAESSVSAPVTDSAFDTTGWGYDQPQQNEIVVVRAAIEYPVFVSLMNANQTNLRNGKRLIMASATFRTEPFGLAPTPSAN